VPMRRVLRTVQDQRDARYGLLRGYFHGSDDDTVAELEQARLNTVTLPLGTPWAGRPLADAALHAMGVEVMSVRRADGRSLPLQPEPVLAAGDALVLRGLPEALANAESVLLGR